MCASCSVKWTRDQNQLFFTFTLANAVADGSTFVVDLPAGRALPEIPPGGLNSEAQVKKLPGVRVINRVGVFPGPTASVYAFERQVVQKNLYRITLPE